MIKNTKYRSRVYIQSHISLECIIHITDNNFNHLVNVLRLKVNDFVSIFNETNGEYLGQIIELEKKSLNLKAIKLIKTPTTNLFNIHLAFAPLKKDSTDFVLEKSTELGVTAITQIITHRTVNQPLQIDKIHSKIVNATQQCGRLDIPKIYETQKLQPFLENNNDIIIFWLNERQDGHKLSEVKLTIEDSKNIILLVGPEGGFTEQECEILKSTPHVKSVYLNTNILRAETACIAAIINFQVINCNF